MYCRQSHTTGDLASFSSQEDVEEMIKTMPDKDRSYWTGLMYINLWVFSDGSDSTFAISKTKSFVTKNLLLNRCVVINGYGVLTLTSCLARRPFICQTGNHSGFSVYSPSLAIGKIKEINLE